MLQNMHALSLRKCSVAAGFGHLDADLLQGSLTFDNCLEQCLDRGGHLLAADTRWKRQQVLAQLRNIAVTSTTRRSAVAWSGALHVRNLPGLSVP